VKKFDKLFHGKEDSQVCLCQATRLQPDLLAEKLPTRALLSASICFWLAVTSDIAYVLMKRYVKKPTYIALEVEGKNAASGSSSR